MDCLVDLSVPDYLLTNENGYLDHTSEVFLY